jgi:hypothetical protein
VNELCGVQYSKEVYTAWATLIGNGGTFTTNTAATQDGFDLVAEKLELQVNSF